MFDAPARRLLERPLDRAAAASDVRALTPDRLTAAGLLLGLGSAGTAALGWWTASVLLWLASRLADGLDVPAVHMSGVGDDQPRTPRWASQRRRVAASARVARCATGPANCSRTSATAAFHGPSPQVG
jgi:hypothetical protein